MRMMRCGKCENCKQLARVRLRVLRCVNPPFCHADQDVVDVWNKELKRLPCMELHNDEQTTMAERAEH